MMLALLALVAAPSAGELAELERCRAAVHGALETAVAACAEPATSVGLWGGSGPSDDCRQALARGRSAGKSGAGLPAVMRAGLVRYFDEAYARCVDPAPAKELPRRDVRQLWD